MTSAPRIVVVEDDPLIATMVRINFERAGWAPVMCADGAAGSLALAEPADAVVLDYMLPDTSGIVLLQALRARGSAVPVLMLTARAETELKVDALDRGADDYLTKPFHVDELLARVRALLRRTRPAG
jgi:DNA-binding response OmpR family regulator